MHCHDNILGGEALKRTRKVWVGKNTNKKRTTGVNDRRVLGVGDTRWDPHGEFRNNLLLVSMVSSLRDGREKGIDGRQTWLSRQTNNQTHTSWEVLLGEPDPGGRIPGPKGFFRTGGLLGGRRDCMFITKDGAKSRARRQSLILPRRNQTRPKTLRWGNRQKKSQTMQTLLKKR